MNMAPAQPASAVRDSSAISEAMENARKRAQVIALNDPQWAPYADLIEVEYLDGSFHYVLRGDEDRVSEALDLEYGANGRRPRSLLGRLPLDG